MYKKVHKHPIKPTQPLVFPPSISKPNPKTKFKLIENFEKNPLSLSLSLSHYTKKKSFTTTKKRWKRPFATFRHVLQRLMSPLKEEFLQRLLKVTNVCLLQRLTNVAKDRLLQHLTKVAKL